MKLELKWFGASLDFGFRAPGCLQIWGVDAAHVSYRLAEVYYAEKELDWWAAAAAKLWEAHPYVVGVADCAEPRSIVHLNERMTKHGAKPVWRPSDKSKGKIHGLNMVRWALENGKVYLLAHEGSFPLGKDQALADADKPTCTEEEIPGYVFRPVEGATDPERVAKDEQPDPRCADHGCDALEMWLTYAWNTDHTPRTPPLEFERGSIGWEYGMDALLQGRRLTAAERRERERF